MKRNVNPKNILYNRVPLQILSFLTKQRDGQNIYGKRLAYELGISQGGASTILKQFASLGILKGDAIGKTIVYSIEYNSPLVKFFRVFENLLELNELIATLKQYCRKIILFGSCSRGEDTHDSDIDLFIVTDKEFTDIVREKINEYNDNNEREIKPVILDTLELIQMEKNDKIFLQEVNKGIILWDGRDE
jgi:predicted nucleotidyltransferase